VKLDKAGGLPPVGHMDPASHAGPSGESTQHVANGVLEPT